MVAVLINGDGHQNGHVLVFTAPVAAQVDAVHINIRIAPTLQGAIASVLNMDVGFFIQLADDGG